MDAFRERLNSPLIAGLVGFLAGLVLGWFVIGWWLYPIQWTDASPAHLRADLQVDYLRMAIDSYDRTRDDGDALQRWNELGDLAPEILSTIEANPGEESPSAIEAFKTAVGPGTASEAPPKTGLFPNYLWAFCLIPALIGLGVAAFYLFRRPGGDEKTPAMQAVDANRAAQRTDYEAEGAEPPLTQFMTTYLLGDDLFDDSFSIDSPAGEFLGECGVGIAETIGVGDPKRVSAFEVWLFDKNDIQTVTKVLMSSHAYNEETTRERLAAKGEPILAKPGNEIVLETATLQLTARVVDMSYGDGALPDESHFELMTLELAVWHKG